MVGRERREGGHRRGKKEREGEGNTNVRETYGHIHWLPPPMHTSQPGPEIEPATFDWESDH